MSGLTLRGCLFELPTWVPLTSACDGSASGGAWTTPTVGDSSTSRPRPSREASGRTTDYLSRQVQVWPTPPASDGEKGGPNQAGSGGDLTLPSAACLDWPTPSARDHKSPYSKEGLEAQLEVRAKPLGDMVAHVERGGTLWPTPRAGSATGGATGLDGGQGSRAMLRDALPEAEARAMCNGQLNPAWVELLMGWPIGWTDIRNSWGGATWPGWPMGMGPDQHPYEPPRSVAKGSIPDRAARLKACGNGVVPQQAAAAYAALLAMAAPFIHAAERTA